MKSVFLSAIILFLGCANTQQFSLYNPFPDKEIIISSKATSCFSTSDIKIWYGLYGTYLINTINIQEVFPSPEQSYRIEYISTGGDKLISIFTGLFFSISRHTMRVDTCYPLKKNTESEPTSELKSNSGQDNKFSDLEKEVAFLKGKISGIESAFPMVSSIASNVNRENSRPHREDYLNESLVDRYTREDNSDASIYVHDKENFSTKEVNSSNSNTTLHSYFLFRINSYSLNLTEQKKIEKLRSVLKNQKNKVLIVGYSDKFGKFDSNLNLSWKRALEVKRFLVKLGVDGSKIQLSAGGEIGDAKLAQQSRRVDLFVLGGNL